MDGHCDTISEVCDKKQMLYSNSFQLDLERMRKAGRYVQFFAAFIDPEHSRTFALRRALQLIDEFYRQMEVNHDYISHCCEYREVEDALKGGKVAAILSIEGGEALQGELSVLRVLYRLGVRSICLTWNYRNELADGAAEEITGGGLTRFGREAVKEMNSLGILVDLSHITEKGFWDVMELTEQPVIVSHSNAKKICNHRRNLTDAQIQAVRDNKGVIGINLYPHFLNETGTASLKDVISHIEHIAGIAGIEHIGMGADFDGIECTPEDIKGVQDIHKIFDELAKLNYPPEFIERLAGLNFLRVIKEVL